MAWRFSVWMALGGGGGGGAAGGGGGALWPLPRPFFPVVGAGAGSATTGAAPGSARSEPGTKAGVPARSICHQERSCAECPEETTVRPAGRFITTLALALGAERAMVGRVVT